MPHDSAASRASESHKRRVLAIGVFDLFHVGHLRYLQSARNFASHLTVAVTTDAISRSIKGKQPVISQDHRLEIIRGLGCVDKAELQPTSTEETQVAGIWIKSWNIDHVAVSKEWEGSQRWYRLIPVLAEHCISVSFVPYTEVISTTQVIEKIVHANKERYT